MDMLIREFDIQHHLVLSKKRIRDHALIRMIVSTLSSPEELLNVRKRDFRREKGRKFDYFTVRLIEGGKSRISPVDRKTFEIVKSMPDQPFRMTEREMDETISKYSPPGRKYNCRKLRDAVRFILSDSDLFGFKTLKSIEEEYAFMTDFNPLYSGLWDLEDEDSVEDFVLNYVEITGKRDWEIVAAETGIDVNVVKKIIERGRKSILHYRR